MFHRMCLITQRHQPAHTLWHHLLLPPISQSAEVLSQNSWCITPFPSGSTNMSTVPAGGQESLCSACNRGRKRTHYCSWHWQCHCLESKTITSRTTLPSQNVFLPQGQFYWYHCKWQQKKSEATFPQGRQEPRCSDGRFNHRSSVKGADSQVACSGRAPLSPESCVLFPKRMTFPKCCQGQHLLKNHQEEAGTADGI